MPYIRRLNRQSVVAMPDIRRLNQQSAVAMPDIRRLNKQYAVAMPDIRRLNSHYAVAMPGVRRLNRHYAAAMPDNRRLNRQSAVAMPDIRCPDWQSAVATPDIRRLNRQSLDALRGYFHRGARVQPNFPPFVVPIRGCNIHHMSPRFLISTVAAIIFLALAARAADKPNFVVFIADDLSHTDTAPYGAKDIRTPNLTRFAEAGMKFTHCFVASPSCGPSRTALLTGLMPARNGAEPNHKPKDKGVASLPPAIHALGYEVAAFGKVAHAKHAGIHGFDHVDDDSSAANVRRWLAGRDAQKPLCLFLGTPHPHVPWSDNNGYDAASFTLPPNHVDTPETRSERAKYATDVTNADRWMGELFDLTAATVKGETLFAFTADHGSQWPFSKWNLYDAGIRVPFIAVWKEKVKPGSVCDAMIQWPDLLPTFIELGGGKVAEGLDGRSFAGVLAGGEKGHRERIFTTHSGDGGRMNVYPIRSVRTRDWKYIRNLHPEYQHHSHISRAAGRDGLIYWRSWLDAAKTRPEAAALVKRHIERPAEELYDLAADPRELKNVAALPEHAKRVAELRAELDAWMQTQGDKQTVFGTPTMVGEPAEPLVK